MTSSLGLQVEINQKKGEEWIKEDIPSSACSGLPIAAAQDLTADADELPCEEAMEVGSVNGDADLE